MRTSLLLPLGCVILLAAHAWARQITGKTNLGSFGPPPPALELKLSFTDPSGDGVLDAGETGLLKVSVTNTGGRVAEGVQVKLVSQEHLRVLMLSQQGMISEQAKDQILGVRFRETISLGNIDPKGTKEATFELEANERVGNQAMLFTVEAATSQGVKSAPQTFGLTVREQPKKPVLTATLEFFEPSGNRLLDAGEAGTIRITIRNAGQGFAKNLTARLSAVPQPQGISFSPTASVGDVGSNEMATDSFQIAALDNVATQTITFTAEISGAAGLLVGSNQIVVATKEGVMVDVTPPTIQILEPNEVAQRGIKIIPDVDLTVKTGSIKIRGIARDSSGVAIVKINDREAPVKPVEGGLEFSADVLLTFGKNTLEIVAIDVHQNIGKETIKVQREVAIVREEPKLPEEKIFKGYQVWAAVIGISDYLSPDVTDLRYADRDADSFYKFLITPLEEGGRGVPKTNIRKLLNKDATKTNIQEAIFDFMKNALEEDVAIIYFAGHGAPDPHRPTVPYLLAYDSDLSRPAATAVKMQEIQDAIRDYIKAKKIIVFADACHSAGVSTNVSLRGTANAEVINQFLEEIAKAGNSVLTFSASESKEYSQESQQWGGGHGVFTYHILKGLQGEADSDDDEIVRLGELVDYVNLNVRKDTKSLQHPTPSSTPWDRNLPFSVVIKEKEK